MFSHKRRETQDNSRVKNCRLRFCIARRQDFFHLARVPGLIAIVDRPNVGKSALFNRIVGRSIAIVHDPSARVIGTTHGPFVPCTARKNNAGTTGANRPAS